MSARCIFVIQRSVRHPEPATADPLPPIPPLPRLNVDSDARVGLKVKDEEESVLAAAAATLDAHKRQASTAMAMMAAAAEMSAVSAVLAQVSLVLFTSEHASF